MGKKFVSIQKADVKLDETEEEKKKFSKLKDMYKPLTDWWKDKLTDFTEKGAMKDAGQNRESGIVQEIDRFTCGCGHVSVWIFGTARKNYESTGLPEQRPDRNDVRPKGTRSQCKSPSRCGLAQQDQ